MNSMNPLREIPLMLMPHLPDTLLGQGIAMTAGVIVTMAIVFGSAGLGFYLATKMGYVK